LASVASALLTISVTSCGGSAAAPWHVILTVKTGVSCFGAADNCGYGIAGVALDGQGNLYLAEMDDDLIYKYSTSGKLLAKWGGTGSAPGQLTHPEKLAFDRKATCTSPRLEQIPLTVRGREQPYPEVLSNRRAAGAVGNARVPAWPVQYSGGHRH
jgi:hypothetical protein